MKEYIAILVRKLISPSMRFELSEVAAWVREQLGRACLWRWKFTRFRLWNDSPYDILYAGRKIHWETARVLLGAGGDVGPSYAKAGQSCRTVLFSEMPLPGALCVPHSLRVIVPLGRTIEEITGGFGDELRRVIRQRRVHYRMIQTLDDSDIERADQEMLQPYARARHGIAASQVGSDVVRKLAQKCGWFHILLFGDEAVACQLGGTITRAKKRYWSVIRCGYPELVFANSKKLHETNSINFYLALECAIEGKFDYFDLGTCLGRPEDGLLQWKKRWGGVVDTMGNHGYFYVRLPKAGAAKFLWDAPLFAVEGKQLTLHLGLPDEPSDEEASTRYRGMGFGGLFKIYLHCARPPSEDILKKLRNLYGHQKSPPILKIVLSA